MKINWAAVDKILQEKSQRHESTEVSLGGSVHRAHNSLKHSEMSTHPSLGDLGIQNSAYDQVTLLHGFQNSALDHVALLHVSAMFQNSAYDHVTLLHVSAMQENS